MKTLERIASAYRGWAARGRARSSPRALTLVVAASFLFVACSGGSADTATSDPRPLVVSSEAPSGDAAPEFQLEVFENENYTKGDLVSLSQFKGQPVVVNFWYPSCAPCRLEMPDLETTFKNHQADGVAFMGVMLLGLDTPEEGQEFIEEAGITYAIGPDSGSIVLDYEVIGFPTSVFLNKRHEIVRSWAGRT